MTERTVKIGDVVDWGNVPDGALVRDDQGWHAIRLRGRGIYVSDPSSDVPWLPDNPWPDEGCWIWEHVVDGGRVTIIALGLTGEETADDLRRLTERFEVREALRACSDNVRRVARK